MIIFFKKTNQNKFHLNTQKLSVQAYLVKNTFVKKHKLFYLNSLSNIVPLHADQNLNVPRFHLAHYPL